MRPPTFPRTRREAQRLLAEREADKVRGRTRPLRECLRVIVEREEEEEEGER